MSSADPVRWGFIGAGNIARLALGPAVVAARNATLQAVAARDPRRARAFADAHGAPAAYGRYEDLLADPAVEAVYVTLPNDAHRPWSVAALEAGKAVLCEKPLALSAAEVDAMAAAAARAGRPLVEASWYRWHPRIRLARRLLAEGAIGRVRHVAAGFTFDGVPAGNYRLDPAHGGGALYDVGCYAISAVLWAFGSAPVTEVTARQLGRTGVDMVTEITLSFAGGGRAEVRAGIAEPVRQWLVVTGEQGRLELRGSPYTAWRGEHTEVELSRGGGVERLPVPAADAFTLMVEETSAVVRGRSGEVLPLAESRATAAVIDAAFASARAAGSGAVPASPPRCGG